MRKVRGTISKEQEMSNSPDLSVASQRKSMGKGLKVGTCYVRRERQVHRDPEREGMGDHACPSARTLKAVQPETEFLGKYGTLFSVHHGISNLRSLKLIKPRFLKSQ